MNCNESSVKNYLFTILKKDKHIANVFTILKKDKHVTNSSISRITKKDDNSFSSFYTLYIFFITFIEKYFKISLL